MENENLTLCEIEDMLDYAWQKAIKYRYDPVVSRIHEEYLSMIKNIKAKKLKTQKFDLKKI